MANHSEAWHSLTKDKLREILDTDLEGLNGEEAERRLQEFGRNTLPAPEPPSLLEVILHQFKSPLIYVLLAAGIVALAMRDFKDAIFIFAVVTLNATIGSYQEWRAEQEAHSLRALLRIKARVRRSGRQQTLDAEEVVPGDIVFFESGEKVPADARLLEAKNLTIDESFLTGESVPVDKSLAELDEPVPVSDRKNMAFAGATVVSGRGKGVVVATGMKTEVGQIASSITETEGAKPPLLVRMEEFARQISIVILGAAIVLGSWAFYNQKSPEIPVSEVFMDVFLLMVALAVSAIPEGLPVAMTVALSIATSRMAKRKVIVRKLMAVESLGSCTTIASDKTGTLTVNQQTLKTILLPGGTQVKVSGEGYNDEGEVTRAGGEDLGADLQSQISGVARAAILCNEASLSREENEWKHDGDAMDVALLAFAHKMNVDPDGERKSFPVAGEIPFESERRYAATAYKEDGGVTIAVKGAVETVLNFCATMRTASGDEPIDKEEVLARAEELAENGYRVLAVASRRLPDDEDLSELEEKHLADSTLLALTGFIDPLRPEVKDAVQEALDAGVRVIMITGDHPATAHAIAEELGIAGSREEVVTGADLEQEFDDHTTPQFAEKVKSAQVFARVSPHQKLQIIEALVEAGEFVAVTGDGVNDAPALRRANIGVAMGSGSDIAKETALITVVDDNFASIVAGIEEGRFAYANVRKVTLLLVSTGAGELLLLSAAIVMALPSPLIAAQILWLNLVTNGIQDVALAFEAGEKGVMKLPPRRPSEGIFNRKMIEQVLIGGFTMGAICLGAWIWMLNGTEEAVARTSVFTLLVLMQFYHVLNCRSEYRSAFHVPLRNNPILMFGMLGAFGTHLVAMYVPFMQEVLETTPLSLRNWLVLGAIAGSVMVAMEIYKAIRKDDPARHEA